MHINKQVFIFKNNWYALNLHDLHPHVRIYNLYGNESKLDIKEIIILCWDHENDKQNLGIINNINFW